MIAGAASVERSGGAEPQYLGTIQLDGVGGREIAGEDDRGRSERGKVGFANAEQIAQYSLADIAHVGGAGLEGLIPQGFQLACQVFHRIAQLRR